MGRRMPPWARGAVDLAGETTDGTRYRYGIVVVLVPRQCAKTTTALDLALGRGLVHRDYRAAYAAQTGHVTTERMGDRFAEVALSPAADRLKVRRSQGTERLTVTANGSYLKAFPPIDGALRSSALDLVIIDEAQEHDDDPLGHALDHTIMPTFTTRPRRQLILLGTAPDRPGTYLERYATLARAGAPGVALVDYGAADDDDLADPAVWHRVHPGLAAGLTDEEYLAGEYRLDPDRFAREHLNVWPRGRPGGAIDPTRWQAAQVAAVRPPTARVHLAVDLAPAGAYAAIAAGWQDGPVTRAAVVQAAEGTAWVDAALRDLVERLSPVYVHYDAVSQAAGVMTRLRLPGARAVPFAEVSAGVEWFLEGLGRVVTVHPDEALDRAAASAVLRRVGDAQRPAWGRRNAGAPIPPLVAVTLAAYGAAATPAGGFVA